MKPERTLQKMYDEYPQLFPTRQQALDHLFCVIGNGYEWVKGELVDCEELYYYDSELDELVEIPFENDDEPDIVSKSPMTDEEYEIEHQKCIEETVELKCRLNERITREEALKVTLENCHKWYPISKNHSYICNLPDDITPEWKALAEECKEMLKKDGIEF
jgi:hypothetical protein